ncbi:MAG: hypothetical protein ACRD8K_01010 [Nitrososphaeraceae archaeon]
MKIRFERNRTSTVIVMYFVFAEKFIRLFFVSSVKFCKLKLPTKNHKNPQSTKSDTGTQGPSWTSKSISMWSGTNNAG